MMDIEDTLQAGCLALGVLAIVATLLLPVALLVWIVMQWG
jgi:hypothetical protein